jgi:predicted Fe-S protein YdhL (DUF1289 family)
MQTKVKIDSPCISLCAVSGQTGFCIGCGRQLKEIAGWSSFSEDERAAIRAELPKRLKINQTSLT